MLCIAHSTVWWRYRSGSRIRWLIRKQDGIGIRSIFEIATRTSIIGWGWHWRRFRPRWGRWRWISSRRIFWWRPIGKFLISKFLVSKFLIFLKFQIEIAISPFQLFSISISILPLKNSKFNLNSTWNSRDQFFQESGVGNNNYELNIEINTRPGQRSEFLETLEPVYNSLKDCYKLLSLRHMHAIAEWKEVLVKHVPDASVYFQVENTSWNSKLKTQVERDRFLKLFFEKSCNIKIFFAEVIHKIKKFQFSNWISSWSF